MESVKTQDAENIFPPEILSLPKVAVPVSGVTGYCLKNEEKQVVFFVFDEGVSIPDHSHCQQHGMVISGEMIIEVDGKSNLYQAGDHYVVPKNVNHRALFSQQTVLIDMSEAPDRYETI